MTIFDIFLSCSCHGPRVHIIFASHWLCVQLACCHQFLYKRWKQTQQPTATGNVSDESRKLCPVTSGNLIKGATFKVNGTRFTSLSQKIHRFFCWTKVKQSSLKLTAGLNNFRTWSKFSFTTGPYFDAIIPKKMILSWRKPSSTHQWLTIQENNPISSRQTPCHPDPGVVKGWHINHWICPPAVMTEDSYDTSIST